MYLPKVQKDTPGSVHTMTVTLDSVPSWVCTGMDVRTWVYWEEGIGKEEYYPGCLGGLFNSLEGAPQGAWEILLTVLRGLLALTLVILLLLPSGDGFSMPPSVRR